MQVLRHDKGILPSNRVQSHLKHVPNYLLPQVSGTGCIEVMQDYDQSFHFNLSDGVTIGNAHW